ncbi:MAG: hypothetical protein K2L76_03370 [Muribaculaceae bacterium]|nr:hypothetical protein [Muribaculaceae bacterium]
MNPNTRVAVNAMATYGRTVLRMGLGLFSSRWVLESLGEVDYGLMGVVGSLIVMVTFLNTVVTGACARFFAFSIGKNDVEDLRKWFNTGLSVHLILAVVLVGSLGPVGEWAIDNFLNIPSDRLVAAHWVFRFSLVSAFWSMISTPYMAMYTATQNIAELTLWEITYILVNFVFVYWLTTYTGDAWLMYAGFSVFITLLLGIGQAVRARCAFLGCHINFTYWGDWKRINEMFSFSGWSLFGSLGYMARAQFPSILLNQFFNPLRFAFVNASYQVGGALAGYTQSMSNSLMGAFTPQITTLAGADDQKGMVTTSFRASKFGTFLTLLFAVPVFIEADYLLVLWLKEPPLMAASFCRLVLLQAILDNLTFGNMSGIMASGRIKWYQITTGTICVLSIPLAWLFLEMGGGPLMVGWALTIGVLANSIARLFFGRAILGIGIRQWTGNILLPILMIIAASAAVGCIVTAAITVPSLLRICITTLACVSVMSGIAWFKLLSMVERNAITHIFDKFICGIKTRIFCWR